jgi:chromosome segregation ATPase
VHFLEGQAQETQHASNRAIEEIGLMEDRISKAKEEVSRLESDLDVAQAQVVAAQRALTSRQAARTAAEGQLESIRQALVGLNTRQSDLGARLAERRVQSEKRRADQIMANKAVLEADEFTWGLTYPGE